VPSSIKLKAELGDDINILFVESQGTSPDDTEAFIYRQKWGGSQALWTHERPCESGLDGIPAFVLLGNDGRVLTSGYSGDGKVKDLIAAELKAAKAVPKDLPPALAKSWQEFVKGSYGAAILGAQKVAELPAADDKAGAAERAKTLVADWTQRATNRVERVKYLIDNAQFAKADSEVLALKVAVKGLPDLESKLAELATRLAGDELKAAREAAKSLDNLLGKVNEKGVEDKTGKELKKLAEKYSGTKPGERAARLSRLLEKKAAQG
jgi:hypothetical protein